MIWRQNTQCPYTKVKHAELREEMAIFLRDFNNTDDAYLFYIMYLLQKLAYLIGIL
jgi:hypothetical protein